ILAVIFILPLFQLIVMPWAADFEVKNVNIAYVDHDHSSYSQQLENKIASSGYFKIVGNANSFKEGMALIEYGTADLVLEIPSGFERNLVREKSQKINLSVDAINGTKSSLGGAYLLQVIADFNSNLDVNIKSPNGQPQVPVAKISIKTTNWYNPRADYKNYMVPGILVLLLTMIAGFLSAMNIVKEKEIGTIEQINVTPIQKWQFILGKLIPFWIIGIIVFTLGLIVMYVIYGIIPKGSLWVLYLLTAVYLIAMMGLGLLISTFSDSQLQAMFISVFFIMIFVLMSGAFTPVDSMPDWAVLISDLTPVTHFIKVVRLIVLKGAGLPQIKNELGYLALFAVVLNGFAIWNYRKTT
uniref:ABC transporter permease n=1 Tax=Pedobacter sp. TaxID=1411316 RepID=UPI003D7FACD1